MSFMGKEDSSIARQGRDYDGLQVPESNTSASHDSGVMPRHDGVDSWEGRGCRGKAEQHTGPRKQCRSRIGRLLAGRLAVACV